MNSPRVGVASLGGTITMTPGTTDPTVSPTLGAEELIAAVPALRQAAHIEAKTLASLPGASLSFNDVLGALQWAESAVDGGCAGAVLIQGTDTLEETAYLLDLLWDRPEPLVLTGAMRAPSAPGAEGPANLLSAVITAAAPHSRHIGAVVVMNDKVHAASRVRKSDTTDVNAFTSADFGPLGRLREGSVTYGNRPSRWPRLPMPMAGTRPRVALLETSLGDDGRILCLALEDDYDGAVISAFGAGHVPREVAAAVGRAAERIPVVFASRTGAGTTLSNTYDFSGSESDLIRRGALAAGWLDARKARILLWTLLASGSTPAAITAEFARRGGSPGGPILSS